MPSLPLVESTLLAGISEDRFVRSPMLGLDPASAGVCCALEDDPFYRSITIEFAGEAARRRAVLASYFSLSIEEGSEFGRCVHAAENPALGVAVWRLPQSAAVEARAAERKRARLGQILGPQGVGNYYRMVDYMSERAVPLVDQRSWYLSIVAVDSACQGQGLGKRLLAPTLAEADAHRVECYLETFSPRTVGFYQSLGFCERARFSEPTTACEYILMARSGSGS